MPYYVVFARKGLIRHRSCCNKPGLYAVPDQALRQKRNPEAFMDALNNRMNADTFHKRLRHQTVQGKNMIQQSPADTFVFAEKKREARKLGKVQFFTVKQFAFRHHQTEKCRLLHHHVYRIRRGPFFDVNVIFIILASALTGLVLELINRKRGETQ